MFTGIRLAYYEIFPLKSEPEIGEVLEKHLNYYRLLNGNEKKRFVQRVQLFLKFTRFYSHDDFAIDHEMKTIIAGAAIQFSFGLKYFIFRYYRKIFIAPAQYKIPEFDSHLLGHVDKAKKTITLSWPNIEHGFAISDDAHNVALHEIAHVVLFENTLRLSYTEFFKRLNWDNWMDVASERFMSLQRKKSPVLRDYAKTNLLEMFAVSVETFFEQPEKLKLHLPSLYDALSGLLNQDPVNAADPVLR